MTVAIVLGVVFGWMLAVCVYGYRHRPRPELPPSPYADWLVIMGIEAQTLAVSLGTQLAPALRQMAAALHEIVETMRGPGTPEERWLSWHWPTAPRIVWWLAGSDWYS